MTRKIIYRQLPGISVPHRGRGGGAVKSGFFFALCGLMFFTASFAHSQRSYALVIGNGEYQREPINTAVSDALLMKATLEGLGFRVFYHENVDRQGFLEAVQEYESVLRRGDTAVFYFAGHGINVGGTNYFVPLGARIFSDTDATFETIPLNRITESFAFSEVGAGMAFIEASYDNLWRNAGIGIRAGMTPVSAGTNTLVAFASGPGQPAVTPEKDNSYFTQSLAEYMAVPGVEIHQLLTLVRRGVSRSTRSRQLPFASSSLLARYVFREGENDLGILSQPFFNIRVDGTGVPVEVYVNGDLLGTTPLLRALPPGEYELTTYHENFKPYSTTVSAESGGYVLVEPELTPVAEITTAEFNIGRIEAVQQSSEAWKKTKWRRDLGIGLLATGVAWLLGGAVALPVMAQPYGTEYYAAESFNDSRGAIEALGTFRPLFFILNGAGLVFSGAGAVFLLTLPHNENVSQ
jgi:hypothetical protein